MRRHPGSSSPSPLFVRQSFDADSPAQLVTHRLASSSAVAALLPVASTARRSRTSRPSAASPERARSGRATTATNTTRARTPASRLNDLPRIPAFLRPFPMVVSFHQTAEPLAASVPSSPGSPPVIHLTHYALCSWTAPRVRAPPPRPRSSGASTQKVPSLSSFSGPSFFYRPAFVDPAGNWIPSFLPSLWPSGAVFVISC